MLIKICFFVLTVLYPYLNLHMKSLGISIQVSDFTVAKILYKSVGLILVNGLLAERWVPKVSYTFESYLRGRLR